MKKISKFRKFINKLLHPKDLYESLWPLTVMLFISGIPPYETIATKMNCSTRVILGRIIGILYLAMFITSYALTVGNQNIFTSFFMSYQIAQIVDIVLMTSTLFAIFLVYLSTYLNKYHFSDILKILVDVDTRLSSKFGINLKHRRTVLALVKFAAVTMVVYDLYVIGSYQLLSMFNHRAYLYTWISYFMPHYILALIFFKYLTITSIIRHRFTTLNKVSECTKVIELIFSVIFEYVFTELFLKPPE